jgi:glucose/arabinose dehydrogenase
MKKAIIILLFFGVGIFAAFTLAKDRTTASPEENYQKYCAGCHGERLESFVNRKWLYGNSWREVRSSIKKGIVEDGMPAYDTTFTNKEIDELTSYILRGLENFTADDFEERRDWTEGVIESKEQSFRVEEVITGLRSPWGLAFLPNGDMLVTDKFGTLYRHNQKDGLQEITGVPEVVSRGQGGLMDVELHPDFEKNNWIYLTFSKKGSGNTATTAVMRAKLKGNKLEKEEIIFEALPYLSTRHHYGSRLEFDKDGYLFVSVGDRGRRNDNPQYLDNFCGKIHRLHDDGSIPKDNPFVDDKKAIGSIYSYGHRNPQGLALHPESGRIWAHEHGPRGGDELNLIQKGENFGWPIISYGINYNGTTFTEETKKEGMLQPKKYWVPSIAPCGMTFVNSDRYPNWKNDLLVGSLRFEYIARIEMDGEEVVEEESLLKNIGRIRDIQVSPDGYIYFSKENPGVVYKLVPVE